MRRVFESLGLGLAAIAALAVIAFSMMANYTFGTTLSSDRERAHLFGYVSVEVDLWKVAGLTVVVALWRGQQRSFSTALALTWVGAVVYGIASAVGFVAQDRIALKGGHERLAANFRSVATELAELEARRRAIVILEGPSIIEARIASLLARPIKEGERVRGTVGQLSERCGVMDKRTVGSCEEVAKLREMLASAVEGEKLDRRIDEARASVKALRDRGAADVGDAQAHILSHLTRGLFAATDVIAGLGILFALLLEAVGAFGLVGIIAALERPGGTVMEVSPTNGNRQPGREIRDYLAERTTPSVTGIGIGELHADYAVWCAEQGVAPLTRIDFELAVDRERNEHKLHDLVRKFGDRYLGLALKSGRAVTAMRTKLRRNRT